MNNFSWYAKGEANVTIAMRFANGIQGIDLNAGSIEVAAIEKEFEGDLFLKNDKSQPVDFRYLAKNTDVLDEYGNVRNE